MSESLQSWDGLRILLAVDAEGSLRKAATRLGLSQPTLGRRVRELEAEVGVPLLVRHARGVAFTTEGRAVLEAARGVEGRLEALRRGLDGRKQAVEGRVRVSCTEPVAMEVLPETLRALRAAWPGLYVDVVVDARASDLDRRVADLAIRMFQPEKASLVGRRVGSSFTSFYASRDYLDRHGTPATLGDLASHAVIGPDREELFASAARAMGIDLDRLAYRTDSLASTLAWVRSGVAIGALLGAVGDRDPTLVPLLEPLNRFPVWLVSHPDLFGSAAVRAVWDQLARDLPAWFPVR
ncbi:MAG: LysR family transcriptional regulator [Myxococcota bacterium]